MEAGSSWPHALLLNVFSFWAPLFFLSSVHSAAAHACTASANLDMNNGTYPAIFVFGDSLSDAGNAVLSGNVMSLRTTQWPYGMTYPGWPTGRYSDGHTLVDFLALHFGLPLLGAYLNSSADFSGGVNYAVGGATAINASFLNSIGVSTVTNNTLDVQLSWHLALQAKVESSNGDSLGSLSKTAFTKGLYVLHIGGDDYTHSASAGYPLSFVMSTIMPLVITQIRNAVETLLKLGAKHFLLVPISPMGCMASMLTLVDGIKDLDGCLEDYNLASYTHGVHVKEEIENFRATYPNATFLFMDYYAAYFNVVDHKEIFGYSKTLTACCGDGGYPYNYNGDNYCNIESLNVCADPSKYISWDGIHFTDSFNFQIINQTFITGTYLDIGLLSMSYHHFSHI